ncbi:MAG TPA: hypothetical protein VFP84_03075 [Kofleriaceae bacterium]|nr:hypothetical protein [Kofleriaceae bacterium]
MLDPQREIQALVDTFVADLSQLAKRIAIEQIKAAFQYGAPSLPPYTSSPSVPAPAPTFQLTSPPSAPAPRGRGRRARNEAADLEGLRNKLVAVITETPGQRTEDLNAALGTETQQIAPVLRKLVADQHIRTEGARRGTRYFVNAAPEAMASGQPAASEGQTA